MFWCRPRDPILTNSLLAKFENFLIPILKSEWYLPTNQKQMVMCGMEILFSN